MNSLKNLRSLILVATFAFAAGCAGISDANLSDAEAETQMTPVVSEADFKSDITSQNNGGDEDIIEEAPRDRYQDRE